MNTTLITNARVIDPFSGLDKIADVAIEGQRLVHLGVIPPDWLSRHRCRLI